MRDCDRGFTLIELLIVILILGVLMAMTIPRIAIVRNQAREAAMKMNLHNVQTVIEEFHAENGYYAEDFYEDGYGGIFPGGVPDTTIGTLPLNPWTNVQMDPDGADYPTGYGLVGIGRGGISIRSLNADEEAVIFLLHS